MAQIIRRSSLKNVGIKIFGVSTNENLYVPLRFLRSERVTEPEHLCPLGKTKPMPTWQNQTSPLRYPKFQLLYKLYKNLKKKGRYNFMAQNPIVTITMQNGDIIKAELYPDVAPISVNNFISLIQKHFYDGLIFHRVIRGFMIQGGCPDGTGMGGPGYSIKGEFAQNGIENSLKHTEGILSMARAMHPNSAGSQFFIMHKNAPHLDGSYAAFGKVIEGMDVVNKIAETATDYSDRPLEPQIMKSVTVDTFGAEYPEPDKL